MKNFIQKVKSVITFLVFALFLCAPISLHAAGTPPGGGSGMPDLSAEDLKMLEEIGKEVEKYVSALPTEAQLRAQGVPEEEIKKRETREKFDAEVEKYSKMSEKQLLEEMEKVFAEAASQMPAQPQPEIEKPTYAPPVQPEISKPVEKPIIPTDKQLAALKLIDDVLASINNFMNKAQIMVELPGKIPTWVKEGKLRNWPASLTWNAFSTQIEELQLKLHKIKDRDPRSASYKYLDDFIKDEALNNNLAKVRDSLMRNEPKIELGGFGLDRMGSETRTAVRSVLLTLHEATSVLGIPAALDKIIEKYEPTAKKIKESEEAAQKRAVEESRRGRYPGASVTSTAPARERVETFGRGRELDRFNIPSLEAPKTAEKPSEALKPGEKGAGGAAGGKEGEKKSEASKTEADIKTDKTASNYEDQFSKGMEAFIDAMNESENTKEFEKHIKSQSFVDDEVIKGINTAKEGINSATKAIRKMKSYFGRFLTDQQKKVYKKGIQDSYKNVKKDIDYTVTQINNLSKPSQVFLSLPVSSSAQQTKHTLAIKSKYYAYFGKMFDQDLRDYVNKEEQAATAAGKTVSADVTQIKNLIQTPHLANLNDLQAKIKDLKKAVDEL